jgi:hypothetical protein
MAIALVMEVVLTASWDVVVLGTLALIYFVIGIVYSCAASFSFEPKRFISPMHIQLASIALIVAVSAATIMRTNPPLRWDFLGVTLAFIFFIPFVFLSLVGILQHSIVRSLVGLTGTKNDVWAASLLVSAKIEDVLAVIRGEELQYALGISREQKIPPDAFLFRTERLADQQHFFIVCSDLESRDSTQVAMASYESSVFGISVPPRAKCVAEMRFGHLREALGANLPVQDQPLEKGLGPAVSEAYRYALDCTKSRIVRGRLTATHFIVAGAVSIFLVTTAYWTYGMLEQREYISSLIVLAIAIVFQLLPRIARRRR